MRVTIPVAVFLLLLCGCSGPSGDGGEDLESTSGSSEEDTVAARLEPGEIPTLKPVVPGELGAERVDDYPDDPVRKLTDADVKKWVDYETAVVKEVGVRPVDREAYRQYDLKRKAMLGRFDLTEAERLMIAGRMTTAVKYLERKESMGTVDIPPSKKADVALAEHHRKAIDEMLARFRPFQRQ